jgi:hypothetical protein
MHTRRQALVGATAFSFALLASSFTFAAPAPQKPLVKTVTGGTIANGHRPHGHRAGAIPRSRTTRGSRVDLIRTAPPRSRQNWLTYRPR